MKKTMGILLALALVLSMGAAVTPAARAAGPDAGIRDIRSFEWYEVTNRDSIYNFKSTSRGPHHFVLYDNGELYLSKEAVLGEKGLEKFMDNVKEIECIPARAYTPCNIVAAILTESGELYIVGADKYERALFGSYSDDYLEPILIAKGISHTTRNGWYYVDDEGTWYHGFPTYNYLGFWDKNPMRAPERMGADVVDVLHGEPLFENGTMEINGKLVSDVVGYHNYRYLNSSGELYNHAGTLFDTGVKQVYNGFYLLNDGTLMTDDYVYDAGDQYINTKVMEDVAAFFDDKYAVRSDGSVYLIEKGSSAGQYTAKKVLSGNGYAPNPAAPYHEGRIFKDASGWAMVDLREARDAGLTVPTANLSYNRPITREKFCEVAVKLYEALSGKKAKPVAVNPFTDTDNPEVLKAVGLKIVNGTSETTFSPDEEISREAIATMLKRTVDAAGVKLRNVVDPSFNDAGKVSSWAVEAVNAMAKANVVRGKDGGMFDPQGNATVEEAVIMAKRILG